MTSTAAPTRWIYDFAEGSADMRELLGGKGANVAEMTRILGRDRVPAGFTITTDACVAYMKSEKAFPDGLDDERARAAHAWMWVKAVATRTACGDDRQLPFVQIDKAERTLSGADGRVARTSHPDSGQFRDVVRFRYHEFHE